MKEHVFLNVFGQQSSSEAQRNKIYQALDPLIVGFGLFTGFVDDKKNKGISPALSFKS